jgi:hypothetical protein
MRKLSYLFLALGGLTPFVTVWFLGRGPGFDPWNWC